MKTPVELIGLFGILISFLLSVVVYFVRLLHVDFRRMQKDIAEMKATTSVIKSEFKKWTDFDRSACGTAGRTD